MEAIKHEENIITDKESKTFYVLRFFAVLSIISAHVVSVAAGKGLENMITTFISLFGRVGVFIFFVLGGFFYKRVKGDERKFWKNKFLYICIPWFLYGTCTYFISVISSMSFSLISYIKWMIGFNTFHYYITIFLVCLVVFKWLSKTDIALYACILLTLISLILYSLNINYHGEFITKYLNPLNWIGYFAFGVLLRKYRLDRRLLEKREVLIVSVFLWLFSMLMLWIIGVDTYFHIYIVFLLVSCSITLFILSSYMSESGISRHFITIGKNSFFIYLIHMQVVQKIASELPNNIIFQCILPIFSLIVMYLITELVKVVLMKVCKNKKVLKMLAINI